MRRRTGKVNAATTWKLHYIARHIALGKDHAQIAASLGMTKKNVSEMTKYPEFTAIQEKLIGESFEDIDAIIKERNAHQVLVECQADAAEALEDLLYNSDPIQRFKASTAILDRTGLGAVQRRAVKQKVGLDEATLAVLRETLEAVNRARTIDVTPEDG